MSLKLLFLTSGEGAGPSYGKTGGLRQVSQVIEKLKLGLFYREIRARGVAIDRNYGHGRRLHVR